MCIGGRPIGADLATVRSAVGDVLRRQALIGLAEAIEAASPDNAQTAQQILTTFVQLIDAEIIIAADNAESGAYDMLRTLRTAVVSDLSARGAQLASLVSYSFNVRMPAIALAYRLYQDASRTRDLISRANAAHPLFMPTQFCRYSYRGGDHQPGRSHSASVRSGGLSALYRQHHSTCTLYKSYAADDPPRASAVGAT